MVEFLVLLFFGALSLIVVFGSLGLGYLKMIFILTNIFQKA